MVSLRSGLDRRLWIDGRTKGEITALRGFWNPPIPVYLGSVGVGTWFGTVIDGVGVVGRSAGGGREMLIPLLWARSRCRAAYGD